MINQEPGAEPCTPVTTLETMECVEAGLDPTLFAKLMHIEDRLAHLRGILSSPAPCRPTCPTCGFYRCEACGEDLAGVWRLQEISGTVSPSRSTSEAMHTAPAAKISPGTTPTCWQRAGAKGAPCSPRRPLDSPSAIRRPRNPIGSPLFPTLSPTRRLPSRMIGTYIDELPGTAIPPPVNASHRPTPTVRPVAALPSGFRSNREGLNPAPPLLQGVAPRLD